MRLLPVGNVQLMSVGGHNNLIYVEVPQWGNTLAACARHCFDSNRLLEEGEEEEQQQDQQDTILVVTPTVEKHLEIEERKNVE